MTRRAKIVGVVAAGLVVLVCWPVGAHYRAKWKVAQYKRQLGAAGEKLSVEELIPKLADQPNGAPALQRLGAQLGSASLSNLPPTMKWLGPGQMLVCWPEEPLPTQDSTNVWPELSQLVQGKAEVLEEVRSALENPVLVFDLNYAQGAAMLIPHLAPMKNTVQWLSAEALVRLHEGQTSNAWLDLKAMAALVERHRDEPVMISELVRIAVAAIAVNATWQGLQAPGWQEPQLAELQAHWQSVDLLAQTEPTLAMERVVSGKTLGEFRESFAQAALMLSGGSSSSTGLDELKEIGTELLDDPKAGFKTIMRRYPGYWMWKWWGSYEDELVGMQAIQQTLEAVRAIRKEGAWTGPSQQLGQALARLRQEHPRAGGFLDLFTSGSEVYQHFLSRIEQLEIQRTLLVTAIALKRYQLKEKTFPPNLEALVPRYVGALPRDIMDGKPLRYRLKPDGTFLLYSVGTDGVDNGGDANPNENKPATNHRWYEARDAVWPQRAGAEQVRAYLAELASKRQKDQEWKRRQQERSGVPSAAPVSSVTNGN